MGRRNRNKKRSSSVGLPGNQGTKGKTVPLQPTETSNATGSSNATVSNYAKRLEVVRQAIDRQSHKSALEKAKQLHKQMGSPESEALLIEAYLARIEGMIAKNMLVEAKALAELMTRRFPQTADRVRQLQCTLAAKSSDVDLLVAPIAELPSPRQWPQSIQDAIRRDVIDPGTLAECEALALDHSLRVAAKAVADAFAAVTSGSVTEDALALPEISRKSPLVPWKWLIRAIACMYQGQDEACLTYLDAVDRDSAAAGLVPAIRSILADAWDPSLGPTERNLVESVAGGTVSLRSALRQMDEDFERNRFTSLHQRVREVYERCEQLQPELTERLSQHLYVKCVASETPVPRNRPLLPKPPLPNAYFWRLMARDAESGGESPQACVLWNQFRVHAVHEGLFAARGPENAFLYLHMADLLRAMDADELNEVQWEYREEPPNFDVLYDCVDLELVGLDNPGNDLYFVYPEKLYERACAVRPDADTFKQWLDYVEEAGLSRPKPDEVAERWASACPEDWRPWLYLAEAAEHRNAFTKALKYVNKVEQLGGVAPKARRARLRLLVAKTLRHLKEGKAHLAPNDFTELQALPSASDPDQQAFVTALQWAHAVLTEDATDVDVHSTKVSELLGGDLPAILLMLSVVHECGYTSPDMKKVAKSLAAYKKKELIAALVRVCPIGVDMNLPIRVPATWQDRLTQWLRKSPCGLDMEQLRILTEAMVTAQWNDTAYHCTRHGLQADRVHLARFLFLRGQCLPVFVPERRQDCLDAAVHLARATRQMDLLACIVDYRRDDPGNRFRSPFVMRDIGDLNLTEEELADIVATELNEKKFPTYGFSTRGRYAQTGECQCPSCRRKRRAAESRNPKPEPKSGKPPTPKPDPQMLLFDDLYDEEADVFDADDIEEMEDIEVEEVGVSPDVPEELTDLVSELQSLNNGRPLSMADLDRITKKFPEMRAKILRIMMNSALGIDLSSDTLDVDLDLPERMPFGPLPRRSNRKKRRR